jgi:FKBP-type peptidyl-prolyl cis-trans isomerase
MNYNLNLRFMSFKVELKSDGTGPTCPPGSTVKVHYTGKLTNGTVFDSSVERGEPLEFVVGEGQVIRGWDEGIVQLKKGQKAILTCPPAYAYGAGGIPGVIPPNATLIFEVELISFQ